MQRHTFESCRRLTVKTNALIYTRVVLNDCHVRKIWKVGKNLMRALHLARQCIIVNCNFNTCRKGYYLYIQLQILFSVYTRDTFYVFL